MTLHKHNIKRNAWEYSKISLTGKKYNNCLGLGYKIRWKWDMDRKFPVRFAHENYSFWLLHSIYSGLTGLPS